MKRSSTLVVFGMAGAVIAASNAQQPARDGQRAPAATQVAQPAGIEILRLDPALSAIIPPDSRVEKVAGGFIFAEGPMWHEGRLWFSDVPGNKIYAMSLDGKTTVLVDHAGGLESYPAGQFKGSNGMATDKDGSVLVAQHGVRRIARLDKDLKPTPFLEKFEGKRFNSPNDLVFAPDGSLWFTDPPYGLTGQDKDPAKELSFNGVFRYANGKLTAAIRDLPLPNGIGFTKDGKTLYVSNSGPQMFVEKYDVAPDGTVSNGTRFIEYKGSASDVPDGLKLDSANNLWTTGPGGIRIISPAGKVLGQIKLPETAANLAWADGGKTLYITASTSIYRLRVATQGAMPLYVK
jgi:gluconolactonase